MSGTIWTKFFWSDWESDPALRLCSLAAQGLWMRMLCIAAAHDPIGYVAVAGRGLDKTSLARMTGCLELEATSLLGELERNGVFSRDRHGRIFSRRMVNDAKKSAIARKNGKFGGNPSLGNKKKKCSLDNQKDKPPLKTQEPEARSQKEKDTSVNEGFDDFYMAYPRKVGKGHAEKAYRTACKKIKPEKLLEAVKIFSASQSGKDPKYIPHPATWLNGERWADDDPPTHGEPDQRPKYGDIAKRYATS
jgi:hypothetical protein